MKQFEEFEGLVKDIANIIRDHYTQDTIEDDRVSLQCASDIILELLSSNSIEEIYCNKYYKLF